MLRQQLESLDEDGDGDISLEEVLHFAQNFAAQRVQAAQEHAAREARRGSPSFELVFVQQLIPRRASRGSRDKNPNYSGEEAEAEAKQLRSRLLYALSLVCVMAGLLAVSTVANIVGTNKIVKNYHFTETRGANLTDADGALLQCAPPNVNGALTAADGGALATKSADLDAASDAARK